MAVYAEKKTVKHYAKMVQYPCGITDIIGSTSADFGPKGWEIAESYSYAKADISAEKRQRKAAADDGRSMRRAKANLRRIALANEFKYFVTLTLNQEKVDRYDPKEIIKKLNAWCSNMVQRQGLCYALVPERHKDGALHFHGFFNDRIAVVDSGHKDSAGHTIYNLPQWSLGFTAAIELYDDYEKAVSYVCKYIGKQGDKPAGRWYYSGGDLKQPKVMYLDLSPADLVEMYGEKVYTLPLPGRMIAVVNGVRDVREQVQKEENNGEDFERIEVDCPFETA